MTKSELTKLILNSDKNIFAIIGPNTSGKSYYMNNNLYNKFSDNVLILDEEGRFRTKENMSKVKIVGNEYIYDNELSRGISNKEYNTEKIEKNTLNMLQEMEKFKDRFNLKTMSLGSKKILNILNAFLSYNLNHISCYLFDEPENSLDDENLKYIMKLFDLLKNSKKKVVFITHSPRLLEMLQLEIDNIFLFQRLYNNDVINHSFKEIQYIFNEVGKLINNLPAINNVSEHEKYDFLPNTKFSELYLDQLLKSSQFYRILFYHHVVIVEGRTEELIAIEMIKELDINKCIFNARGKYQMIFLIKLFSLYCNKLSCIIDSDEPKNAKVSLAAALTKEIEKLKEQDKIFIYAIPKDLESYLGFDTKEVVEKLTNKESCSEKFIGNFTKYKKEYLPYFVIKTNNVARNNIKKLFDLESNSYEF